jgi:cyclopropane-fatty-acyl-phospholipid synthase
MTDCVQPPHRLSAPIAATKVPAAARTVLRLLDHLRIGSLDLHLPDGSHRRFGNGNGHRATMRLHDWSVCSAVLQRGDIGLADSYLAGGWHTPDLTALLRLFIANREVMERVVYGSWWGSALQRLRHLLNRNSRAGSRRNIAAHYDLGNDFYRLWLDPTMNYSSAWFEAGRETDLVAAQQAKMRRALQQAGVQAGSHVLEIGCGWGAVAEMAARDFGARLTGITLSQEQLRYGHERLAAAGLDAASALRLQDYRDLGDARFDAVVSIEMFEAVGREYWPGYFKAVHQALKPGCRACVQTITIRDDLFERYARSTDFIQQYIFPGGMLPSASEFRRAAEAAGLVVETSFHFGPDYAETLRRWHTAFQLQAAAIEQQGYDSHFMRLWAYYLCYCEAAFDEGNTDVVQFTLRKP